MLDSPSLHCRFTATWPSLPRSFHNNSPKFKSPFIPNSTKLHSPHFNLSLVHGPGRMVFPGFALKKSGKGGAALTEQNDSDIEFDEFFDEDEDDFQDEEEDEDDMLLPLKNMREWLAAKPRGFGEGKEYDTSVEEKLLQEIELSVAAQAANISKLKNQSSSESDSRRNVAGIEEIVNTGVRVRVVNLPKKKNIHRDLMVAFKGFPGIINITPAVLGNKKTRDPICKGFAFVDCKSEGDAKSFLQAFSGQYLMFGRIQKQIKCEIVNRQTSSSDREIVVGSTNHSRLSILPGQVADLNVDLASEVIRTRVEEIAENMTSDSEFHSNEEDSNDEAGNAAESISESKLRSASQKKPEKIQELEQTLPAGREEVRTEISPSKGKTKVSNKKQSKEKGEKKSSKGIPGSAKRLRVKEKSILTDVYSRYGKKPALVSKEGS